MIEICGEDNRSLNDVKDVMCNKQAVISGTKYERLP
jgi:hypothetical protein